MSNSSHYIYCVISLLGLFVAFWLGFTVELPLAMYLIGLPLIIFPSIILLLQTLSKTGPS